VSASTQSLLLEHYNLQVELTRLDGERDENYLASSQQGQRYVAKLMHVGCREEAVNLQCLAIKKLQGLKPNLPELVPSSAGEDYTVVSVGGERRILWVLSWCNGTLLADYSPHTDSLYESFGQLLGQVDKTLQNLEHPAARRAHEWDLTRAGAISTHLPCIEGPERTLAEPVLRNFDRDILPLLSALPHGVIHNDANDYNVLVEVTDDGARVTGLFDFGDTSYQPRICEVAIALAYLILDKPDPLSVCAAFLRGYHAELALTADELSLLLALIKARLSVSIAISSHRQKLNPDDPYITVSQAPAKAALRKLAGIAPRFAECVFRTACDLPALPHLQARAGALQQAAVRSAGVIAADQYQHIIDLSIGSLLTGANPANAELKPLTRRIEESMETAGVRFGFGRWSEARGIYSGPAFGEADHPTVERRTEHMGVDIFCAPGTPVFAPLDGEIVVVTVNDAPQDYGPLVILRHGSHEQDYFYTLYGHLCTDSIQTLRVGQRVTAGTSFAAVGNQTENGGWTPHLHLQIMLDLLDLDADFPGVVAPGHADLWRELCPNPAVLIPGTRPEALDGRTDVEAIRAQRTDNLCGALSLSYQQPLHIVRGFGQYLYDSSARCYLDAYNNVAHVGHCHPRVVEAVQRQTALLNTNTRYLHENINNYAQALKATLPAELDVCLFVNSASEANELALRLARNYTGHRDICVVEAAYHGHTSSLIEMSPYKYNGPGGQGRPDWVHEVPLPDDYRGPYKRDNPDAGLNYAADAARTMDAAIAGGRNLAGFIAETLPSVGGQIVLPTGYLQAVYGEVRQRGGVCIADEVQVGFGRLGDCFWGFESQQVIPDIIVLGKPIANGYPLGAVITRREIAESFDNGMEFFSTFGGNPVACAAGQAVLEVIREEGLQANALELGQLIRQGLGELQQRHSIVGDVRGKGLFLGLELVSDRDTLTPAAAAADYVVNRLRQLHILAGTDGPLHNVVKIRPPMVINRSDAAMMIETLDRVLTETAFLRD
jgi:4-aminobutyrate aminotransferase-like enzyme/Ser/Thr protein kinase RdoA (MazF antagonist)